MKHSTCSLAGCQGKPFARGKCEEHYVEEMRETEAERLEKRPVHRLSSVDINTRTATCSVCGPTKITWDSHQSRCVTSRRHNDKYWKPSPETARRGRLKKYGITVQDYETMYRRQDGRCAICRIPKDVLMVDHDHSTGAVRDLLCGHCNSGIGFFRDNPLAMAAGAAYLLKHTPVSPSPTLS